MATNDTVSQLGKQSDLPVTPSMEIIEYFQNPVNGDYWVEFRSEEFTSVCPKTGQPDFGRVSIRYVPGECCIESKSLKLYLASYRSTGQFWEALANRIADDLAEAINPRILKVIATMNKRGGISMQVEAERRMRRS